MNGLLCRTGADLVSAPPDRDDDISIRATKSHKWELLWILKQLIPDNKPAVDTIMKSWKINTIDKLLRLDIEEALIGQTLALETLHITNFKIFQLWYMNMDRIHYLHLLRF